MAGQLVLAELGVEVAHQDQLRVGLGFHAGKNVRINRVMGGGVRGGVRPPVLPFHKQRPAAGLA